MASKVVPIILCGGAGTRLWPLSTPSKPKPFHAFSGSETLFQHALRRACGVPFTVPPIVVASDGHESLVVAQASEIGVEVEVLLEQEAKNSCAAALSGTLWAQSRHGPCLAAILAADQDIPDADGFRQMFAEALAAADAGDIVLFGVPPTGPRSSFGYVVPGPASKPGGLSSVRRFVEKPEPALAAALISDGALWNSGNFLASSEVLLGEAASLAPLILAAATAAVQAWRVEGARNCFGRYGKDVPGQSLDTAVIERSASLAVKRCDLAWSDLGTWDDVRRVAGGSGNYVRANGTETLVLGLEDVIVVSTPDGILVTRLGQSDALKAAVSAAGNAAMVNKR